MRWQLFEFEDLPWFPNNIREGGTDYLRYFLNTSRFYEPIIPLLADALQKTGQRHIIDLCSGGGGNIEQIQNGLEAFMREPISVTITDKFPNVNAFKFIRGETRGRIGYSETSVDATNVHNLEGFRTMFSAVHHFRPETVEKIIKSAVDGNSGIALIDGGDKHFLTILGIILFQPVSFLLATPFFRPFRFSRIFFTYVVPAIPLMTMWDGIVSIMRLYRPDELLKMATAADGNYTWKCGKVRNRIGMKVTYLIGYPN